MYVYICRTHTHNKLSIYCFVRGKFVSTLDKDDSRVLEVSRELADAVQQAAHVSISNRRQA